MDPTPPRVMGTTPFMTPQELTPLAKMTMIIKQSYITITEIKSTLEVISFDSFIYSRKLNSYSVLKCYKSFIF